MTEEQRGECSVGTCGKPVEKSGLCAAHRKRAQRKKKRDAVGDPPRSVGRPRVNHWDPVKEHAANPLQAIERAGLELADADAELSATRFSYIKERLRSALRRAIQKREAKKSNAAPTRSDK